MTTAHTGFTKVALDAFEGVAEEPGVAKPDPIMVADSVTRRFGGLTAVRVNLRLSGPELNSTQGAENCHSG